MSFIPDPERPHGPALDTETGALAPAVLFVPQGAGLDQAVHIGWATGFRRTDGEDLQFNVRFDQEDPTPETSHTVSDLEYIWEPRPGDEHPGACS